MYRNAIVFFSSYLSLLNLILFPIINNVFTFYQTIFLDLLSEMSNQSKSLCVCVCKRYIRPRKLGRFLSLLIFYKIGRQIVILLEKKQLFKKKKKAKWAIWENEYENVWIVNEGKGNWGESWARDGGGEWKIGWTSKEVKKQPNRFLVCDLWFLNASKQFSRGLF